MKLHPYSVALPALLISVTLFSQQAYTLKQTLAVTKSNNAFLKTTAFNVPVSQSDVITAGLRPNPVLNNQTLQLVNSKNYAPDTKFYQPQNRQVWWQLTKPFPLNNQRKYRIDVAEKSVTVTEKTVADAQRMVLFDAGNKWLDVWQSKMNLDLIGFAKKNIDTLVQTNELRLKRQVISTSDFERTQLLANQYYLQARAAEQQYKNQLQDLKLIMGVTDSVVIEEKDAVISMAITNEIDSLLHLSYRQRPDVQAAQGTIEVAKSNIQLQRSLGKPVPELGFIWNPQNTVPYFGFFGTIELPFFSRNQGERKKSRILLQQSEQSLITLQKQVQTEVQTTYSTYQLNKEVVEKSREILQKSTQVLEAVKYSYTRGGTTIIDFLDAQRTWFDTQKTYYEAEYNYRKSYLQLLFVTGLIDQL